MKNKQNIIKKLRVYNFKDFRLLAANISNVAMYIIKMEQL